MRYKIVRPTQYVHVLTVKDVIHNIIGSDYSDTVILAFEEGAYIGLSGSQYGIYNAVDAKEIKSGDKFLLRAGCLHQFDDSMIQRLGLELEE